MLLFRKWMRNWQTDIPGQVQRKSNKNIQDALWKGVKSCKSLGFETSNLSTEHIERSD